MTGRIGGRLGWRAAGAGGAAGTAGAAGTEGAEPHRQGQAYSLALVAVFLWSTVATAFKLALRELTPDQLLLWSSVTAAVVLGVVLGLRGLWARVLASTPRELARSLLLGLLNPFLYYVVLFRAYDRLPGQMAQPLNYTWALAIALLSVPLLKQKIGPSSLIAILLSLFGVLVISTQGKLASMRIEEPLGVGLAVGSSVIWALFWVLNLRDTRDATVKLFLSFCAGALLSAIWCGATGQLAPPPLAGALGAVYVGLFEMGLTFLIWMEALRRSRTTAAVSNLIFLSPFVSLFLLHLFAGEALVPASFAGLACIVAGILLQQRVTARRG